MLTNKKLIPDHVTALVLILLLGIAVISKGFSSISQLSVYVVGIVYFFWDGVIARRYLLNKKIFYRFLVFLIIFVILFFTNSRVMYNSYNGFYFALILFVTYKLSESLQHENAWKILSTGIVAVTVIDIGLTMYQSVLLDTTPRGFFESQNSNGAFLNMIAVLSLSSIASFGGKEKRISLYLPQGMYLCCCITIFLIGSRAVFISHLIVLMTLLMYLISVKQGYRVLRPIFLIVLAYVCSGLINQWQVNDRFDDLFKAYMLMDKSGESRPGNSFRQRLIIWKSTWQMLSDTSFMGSGYSSFHMRYPQYRSQQDTSSGQYVHNDYLQILLELGYPGLSLLLAGLIYLVIKVFRSIFRNQVFTRDNLEKHVLLLAIGTVWIHSFVSYNFYVMPVMILMCLCLGRYSSLRSTVNSKELTSRDISRILPGGIFLVLILPLLAMVLMNHNYQRAYSIYQAGGISKAEATILEAERWFPTENIHLFKSLLYLQATDGVDESKAQDYIQWAHDETHKAERLNPFSPDVHYYRGLIFEKNQQYEKALNEFTHTLTMNNRHYMSRLEIAKMAETTNNIPMARNILEQGIQYTLPRESNLKVYMKKLVHYRYITGDDEAAEGLQNRLYKIEPLLKE